ncbi:MAG: glycosyltransferase family 2 protein [Verrucomicrobiota bacterium]
MAVLPLSIAIIASNEEANLRRCLAAVHGWTAEVIVVVNDCRDGTVAVAREAGALVHEQAWTDYATQKNSALDRCTQPWVLALDADEEVSRELRAELERWLAAPPAGVVGAEIPRCTRLFDRWVRHGEWYPDRVLRLVRNGTGRWGGDPYHTAIRPEGRVVRLHGDLLHYGYPDTRSFVARINRQADYFARHQHATSLKAAAWTAAVRGGWRFFRSYVVRLGFLDGFAGLFVAATVGYACFVRYSRLYEKLLPLPEHPANIKHIGDT